MATTDPRIDAYIERAAPFAHPILTHLRATVHAACPDVRETIKWGMPYFEHGGRILAHMAAFKQHCAFGIHIGEAATRDAGGQGMGNFGRITTSADLPPRRELKRLIESGMAAIDAGEKAPRAPKSGAKPAVEMPPAFAAALAAHAAARLRFEAFAPSHRREYVEWIADARRDATRERRIAQAIAQIAEGRTQNWKYERPKKS
jgi:hypothetical protein